MIELHYREEFEKNKDGVQERYHVIVVPLFPSLGDHSGPGGGFRGRDLRKTINRAAAETLRHLASEIAAGKQDALVEKWRMFEFKMVNK